MLAPVIVFAYNREKHLEKTLEELSRNRWSNETDVYIFVDGPKCEYEMKKVEHVRKVAVQYSETDKFKNIILNFSDSNKGLANSIIEGVTKVIKKDKKVIVLEDDLLTSPDFLEYMNYGLDFYENEGSVGAISGFAPALRKKVKTESGIYKSRTGNSYGWGTWEDRWLNVDWEVNEYDEFIRNKKMQRSFDKIQYGISDILIKQMNGELSSWAVRWDYHFWRNHLWTIYPAVSHVSNIGFDGNGTTCNNLYDRRKKIAAEESEYQFRKIEELQDCTKLTADSFRPGIIEVLYEIWKNKC